MEHACTVEKTKREKERQGMVQTYKDSLLLFQKQNASQQYRKKAKASNLYYAIP